jgi:isopentenyl-diphosphate delta-isomerase
LLENVELIHQPLTSIEVDQVDLSANICGKLLKYPLIISAMTGGTPETGKFNREVAAVASNLGIGFGVGSQRAMLDHPEVAASFRVREAAPHALILGNIGIAQARELPIDRLRALVTDIGGDALCVHLNTAMEIVQHHGDRDFTGSREAISRIIRELGYPVIVKETGCGFARESGKKLAEAGVEWVDVSGAGGTSWVGVETLRNRAQRNLGEAFWDWGIPTAASLLELKGLGLKLIAGGGIRTGMQAAKALSLGASAAAMALPVLRAYIAGGTARVEEYLTSVIEELRAAVVLCGHSSVSSMSEKNAIITGALREWALQRRLQPFQG